LRHFRAHRVRSSRLLWIDAICINQEDVDERNHQVQMMFDIYQQAQVVRAWIGCKTEEVDERNRRKIEAQVEEIRARYLRHDSNPVTGPVSRNLEGLNALGLLQRLGDISLSEREDLFENPSRARHDSFLKDSMS
jgi:Heterokaryon incompatibility protein (HET)